MEAKIAQIVNHSPIFKGTALVVLGILALMFSYFMKKKWNEKKSFGFSLFQGIAIFIVLFGLFILIYRPNWWGLPY